MSVLKNREKENQEKANKTEKMIKGSKKHAQKHSSFEARIAKKAVALILCAGAGAAGGAFYVKNAGDGNVVINTVGQSDNIASETSAGGSSGNSTDVAKKISASVVAITTENVKTSQSWFGKENKTEEVAGQNQVQMPN